MIKLNLCRYFYAFSLYSEIVNFCLEFCRVYNSRKLLILIKLITFLVLYLIHTVSFFIEHYDLQVKNDNALNDI